MAERKKMRSASYKKNKEDLIDLKEEHIEKNIKRKKTPKIIEVDVNDKNAFKIRNKNLIIKKYAFLSMFIILGLVVLTSTSYAIFTMAINGAKNYTLKVGTLDFEIQNETNSIRLMNGYPMTDSEGQSLTPYTFTIKNTGTLKADYEINLIDDDVMKSSCTDCSFLDYNRIKVELKENGNTVLGPVLLSNISSLITGSIESGASNTYELRLWLDYENTTIEDTGKIYYGKISVNLTQEALKTSTGSYINLNDGQDSGINQIKIYGNTEDSVNLGNDGSFDLVVTGKNLIKKQGYSTPASDTEFWSSMSSSTNKSTPLSDGWANAKYDNTSGESFAYRNLFIGKKAVSMIYPSENYTYYYELKNNNSSYINRLVITSYWSTGIDYFPTTTKDFNSTDVPNKNIMKLYSRSDFSDVTIGMRTYFEIHAGTSLDVNIRAMLLYGDVTLEDIGDYEHYKERRYTINLIDDSGNVINGLGTGDVLQKINGVYGITKSDGSMIDLSLETQNVLNSISTYEGVSNIFIEEDIVPSNMEITYLSK